ncbi:hypothetical protein [Dyadobacter psychrophilus]|uniref:Helix-turn-helix domain-containing protein n=1 Tax=Dyadobacter psychrophilus TaxID=651661 RepID=A0A1T5HK16_9BACT|nr:hypothetical protein [Dyadobacter psychrophilus]SKC21033.1 hypothetical protein SAMN05660293_05761 [Dyadobacter psychrophilus]
MNYITLKEAAKATGLNEMTIRRLCKKADSKPYIRLKEGKNGSLYTIQTNYLFDKYPPKTAFDKLEQDSLNTRVNVDPIQVYTQDYTPVLAVKDELIQVLKDEIAYLREENKGLREENKELKLLPAPHNVTQEATENHRKSFWQRIWGK